MRSLGCPNFHPSPLERFNSMNRPKKSTLLAVLTTAATVFVPSNAGAETVTGPDVSSQNNESPSSVSSGLAEKQIPMFLYEEINSRLIARQKAFFPKKICRKLKTR